MSDSKFNWKSLFIKEDESAPNVEKKESTNFSQLVNEKKSTVPSSQPLIMPMEPSNVPDDLKNSILEMYEKGFDSLNKSGYDFFEYFKSIMSVDANNNGMFQMAFTMAQSVQPGLTKESLLKDAEEYISEINKVYTGYDTQGQTKILSVENAKQQELQSLNQQIISYENQIKKLQEDMKLCKDRLDRIDDKYDSEIKILHEKRSANDLAKNSLIQKINFVKNGLQSHVK